MGPGIRILVAAAAAAGVACAHRPAAGHLAPALPADTAAVRVNVVNNYATQMDVFAVGISVTYRMGTVAPGIPREFVLRRDLLAGGGQVRFLAQATGVGPRVQSDEVHLMPGDIVDFEIATELIGSRAIVRP